MATNKKPEIYFEVGTGFFRIPTSDANYNITILGRQESSVTRVVERIVEKEKGKPVEDVPEEIDVVAEAENQVVVEDDFYHHAFMEMYQELGTLSENFSAAMSDLQPDDLLGRLGELEEAGEKQDYCLKQLQDVQNASAELVGFFTFLENHPALSVTEEAVEEAPSVAEDDESGDVQNLLSEALTLLGAMQDAGEQSVPSVPAPVKGKKTRYLFDLDVVFQTLYELCTNETVKEHISSARERASEIFVLDKFYDAIAPKAATYETDSDNFFNVPMSDVFASLRTGCTDKGISNLLKKMDAGQASIFLDQAIPLEVPPTEEVEVETEAAAQEMASGSAVPDPRVDQVKDILAQMQGALARCSGKEKQNVSVSCGMSSGDKEELLQKTEEALAVVSTINGAVGNAADSLGIPGLPVEQVMEFFSRLSDCQKQLLRLVLSCGENINTQ